MSEDRCICCGEIVPEGRMVCPACEKRAEKERDLAEELVSKWARGELVEVVRCKDCKFYNQRGSCFLRFTNLALIDKNNFCSCGRRKEKANDPR